MAGANGECYVLPHNLENYLGQAYLKSLKCFHLNIRSAMHKEPDLSLLLNQLGNIFDVIMLTETWGTDDTNVFRLPSYQTFYVNRSSGRGGGLCILVKNIFTCELLENFCISTSDCEFMSLKLQNTVLAVGYRPPNGRVAPFLDYLEDFFAFVNDSHFDLIFGGDVNINMLSKDSAKLKLDVLLTANGLANVINLPTRVTLSTSSLIDIFVTNITPDRLKAGVIMAPLSDHFPIFLCCRKKVNTKKNLPAHLLQRVTPQNLSSFLEKISIVSWGSVYNKTDACEAYEELHNILKPIYVDCFPFVRLKLNPKIRKPWITPELAAKIQQKNTMFSTFVKNKDPDALKKFRTYRNRLDKELKKVRKQHFNNLFASVSGCTDALWRNLNSLLNYNVKKESVREIKSNGIELSGQALANAFNNHIVNTAHQVTVSNDLYNVYYNSSSVFLDPVSEAEVTGVIKSLSNSSAIDIYGMQVKPLKHVISFLAPCISYVFNLCLEQAVFPYQMQVARVKVLYKKGDKNDMGNYRPVSILPVLSKAFEKIILERFSKFEQKHNIIIDCQYGFRKNFSTESALLTQKEYILDNIEKGNVVLGIFIDFSRAFDLINHELLIKKLERYGFRGMAASLIRSYLEHRKQIVDIEGICSDPIAVSCGVPQGSILGPFLFNLYINDITAIAPAIKFVIYADDTSIFLSAKETDQVIRHANEILVKLEKWTHENLLKINEQKTKAVLFHATNKNIIFNESVLLNSTPVEIVPYIKTLGVFFHETISWDEHINQLTKKLSQVVGLVYRNASLLPRNVMMLLYNTLFCSRLNYCHLVWASTTQKNLYKILILQKRFLRAVANVPVCFPSAPLFSTYNVLPVTKAYDYRLCKQYKKEVRNNTSFLCQLGNLKEHSTPYSTRNFEKWKVDACRTTYGLQMLKNRLPRLLNALHTENIEPGKITFRKLREYFSN